MLTALLFLTLQHPHINRNIQTVDKITLEIVIPWNGQAITAHTPSGQAVALTHDSTGRQVTITPEALEDGTILIHFTEKGADGAATDLAEADLYSPLSFSDREAFVVTVLGSFKDTVPTANARPGKCCVSCGGVTACGCAVEHSCGSCCAEACCPDEP